MWSQAFDFDLSKLGENLAAARSTVDRSLNEALAKAKAEAEKLEGTLFNLDGSGQDGGAGEQIIGPDGTVVETGELNLLWGHLS